MWVADMEFATAPAVCQAMKERIDRRIFGYTNVFGTDYYEALKKWCEDLYGWSFPQEELTFSSGIIPALYELAEDLLEKDETILITTPASVLPAIPVLSDMQQYVPQEIPDSRSQHFYLSA